jgi:hypothetical protein
MNSDKPEVPERRRFLQGVAAAGGAGALMAASGRVQGLEAAAQAEAKPDDRGYRLTEHIAAYYRTLRV